MLAASSSIALVVAEARVAAVRFPGSLLAALTSGSLFACLVGSESRWASSSPAALSVALGIPLFLALDLTLERASRLPASAIRAVAYITTGAVIAVHFWLTRGDATANYPVRYLQLSLAAHLLVAFAAFVGRDEENGFWQFNRHLFLRFLEASLYAAVFFVGVSLGALAASHLFAVKVHGTFYARLWLFSVFVLLTWRFLAVVPRPLAALQRDARHPRGLRLFIQYLLVPLATLYGVILYAYLGKVVVLWSLPKGEVGWLVSAASVFGMFTLLMLYPAAGPDGPRWARVYSRAFWPAIVPLLGMLFVALGQRVGQYGVTEHRYFLGALAAWLLIIALYFIVRRRPRIIAVPLTLALFAAITLAGPWGAYAVSLRSQQARLETLLVRHGLWRDGRIEKATGEVRWEDMREMSSVLSYLSESHGPVALSRWFAGWPPIAENPPGKRGTGRPDRARELMAGLGLQYVGPYEAAGTLRFDSHDDREAVTIAGYDHMVELTVVTIPRAFTLDGREYDAWLDAQTASFVLRHNSVVVLKQSVTPLLESLRSSAGADVRPRAPMTLAWEGEQFEAKLIFRSLTARQLPDGRIEPIHGAAVLLLRRR